MECHFRNTHLPRAAAPSSRAAPATKNALPPPIPTIPSCAIALLAQFYPGKPPATTPLLAACVTAYALLSVALSAIAALVERDAFLFTRGGGAYPPLAVGARMARFDPAYELIVEERGTSGGPRARAATPLSATQLVRADGRVDKGAVEAAVAKALAAFETARKKQ